MGLREVASNAIVTGGAIVSVAATPAQAVVASSDLAEPVKDAAVGLITDTEDAFSSAARGIDETETGADPVPEPLSAVHSDPPPGVDIEALADTWTEADQVASVSDMWDGGLEGDIAEPDAGGVF